jgi:hypothetical protein
LPTGVSVIAGKLFVADAWHHRVLVWERLPDACDTPPDYALGQADLTGVEPNRGGEARADTLYWPFGLAFIAGWLYIADTGNRRVLGWRGLPAPGQPADLILGQPDATSREENRGGPVGPDSFRWPHAVAGDADTLYVADAGNHRVLAWSPPPIADRPADLVLGQDAMDTAHELAYFAQGPARQRFPYSVAFAEGALVVADTANNRLLRWSTAPRSGANAPANYVLGQVDFASNGENHWKAVTDETLCWPYGICLHRGMLAVADSGNNRTMIWAPEGAS